MISSKPRFKYLIFSALLYAFPTNAICYWPNGDTTPQDVACRDDSDNSACCSPGFACLDNGLCMTTRHVNLSPSNVTYVRGSCTDQTWKSSRCPNYCVRGGEPFGDIMDGMQGLANCNNTSGAPEYYCVDLVGGNCTAQENLIAILSGDPTKILTTIGFEGTTTLTSTLESTTTSYVSSRSTSTSMSTTASISSPTPYSQTSPSSSAAVVASKQGPSPESVGLGVGLGVPLGLLALGLAGWLLFKKHKKGTKPGQANRISELPVEEPVHEAPQPKQWRREELSGDSWAPSEMPADP